ncbi:MAG: hypothetical protein ACLQVY_20500 [Limisphaerales bacterium]
MLRRLLLLGLLATVAATSVRAQVSGVAAELVLDQHQYLPDEDLQLKVRITNRSGQPLTLGQDDSWISFEIVGEKSYLVAKLAPMPVAGEFTLLSGQVGTRALNPTPYFDFRRPGHYRIGASVRLEQWGQTIDCKPVVITVANGVPLPNLANLQVGLPLPPGVTNALPEIRHFSLLKVPYLDELKLYVRLTDDHGHTLHVFPLARMLSFSVPEAQVDRASNLHVLLQTGARSFTYSVVSPEGRLLVHQMHDYTETRPTLRITDDAQIYVAGGVRRFAADDMPTPDSANSR